VPVGRAVVRWVVGLGLGGAGGGLYSTLFFWGVGVRGGWRLLWSVFLGGGFVMGRFPPVRA